MSLERTVTKFQDISSTFIFFNSMCQGSSEELPEITHTGFGYWDSSEKESLYLEALDSLA